MFATSTYNLSEFYRILDLISSFIFISVFSFKKVYEKKKMFAWIGNIPLLMKNPLKLSRQSLYKTKY